ncbi:MAG: ACP S-malonyltransferase [Methylococcales bacterium]|nr:ACP S-malonyltransferase [Methylococcales bacterium]
MNNNKNNLAFVFPGQGSQSVGMLSELAQAYPEVEQVFSRASSVLGFDLWQTVSKGPVEALSMTQNTQPAMLASGVAVWEVWCKTSETRPAWVAGHSLGEYTALVCAGALSFEDAVGLVAEAARLMQEAVPSGVGAMAAILGLEDAQVIDICTQISADKIVSAVNFNAPGQVVIAGHADAVEQAIQAAKDAGAKRAIALPVSVPSHCALMQPAAEQLNQFISKVQFESPQMAVIHNVDARAHESPDDIGDLLIKQLYQPVRWAESVQFLSEQGVDTLVECGPGKVLAGLSKRIIRSMQALPVFDSPTLKKAQEAVV